MERNVSQFKQAFIIITDLHDSYKGKDNRYDYLGEIAEVKKKIIDTIMNYRNNDYLVSLIFLGDIFDMGYKDIFSAIKANNFFIILSQLTENIYSVVGNHELSYYSNNPFYTLLGDIRSEKIRKIKNKIWKPIGLLPIIEVIDELDVGDTVFHFNHYDTYINRPHENRINIGLFHQSIVNSEILNDMRMKLKREEFHGVTTTDFKTVPLFRGYQYAFFGHAHKLYGTWNWIDDTTGDKTVLSYLASLGRPNYLEVNDNNLERDLPTVIFEKEKFSGIEHNKFILPDEAHCIRKDVVKVKKEKYELVKERKQERDYTPISDNPLNNLLTRFETESERTFIKELLEYDMPQMEVEVKKKAMDILRR